MSASDEAKLSEAKFNTGHFVSLDKHLQLSLTPVYNELANMSSAIEKLSVSTTETQVLKYQVASQSEMLHEIGKDFEQLEKELGDNVAQLQKQVDTLENFKRIAMWLFGVISALGMALLTRWATSFVP